ncbi:MAG: hypothetical protein PHO70_08495 [Candidatus Omnitrophica bacterium]|nr:hypothetical protein [Candidatus Omnitrophota bacterium]
MDKTTIVDDLDVQLLPKEIEQVVPRDDKYLLELAYSSIDKIIITTDIKLKEKLKDIESLKIFLLDEFLSKFQGI